MSVGGIGRLLFVWFRLGEAHQDPEPGGPLPLPLVLHFDRVRCSKTHNH